MSYKFSVHKINLKELAMSLALPFVAGLVSYLISGDVKGIYNSLDKPSFSPPAWIFPVVWNILFWLLGISCYLIRTSCSPLRKTALTYYGIQLCLNAFWTFIFFRLGYFLFALIWLGAILILVIIMQTYFYKIKPAASYLNVPYMLWLVFAGILNMAVYFMN